MANKETTWYVYMLRCADHTFYTGVATDVSRRTHEHNHDDKKAARYTRGRRPVIVVYCEQVASRQEALRREAQIKRMPRAGKLRLIE